MSEQTIDTPTNFAIELANIEMKISQLTDLTPAVDQITGALEDLYNQGAPVEKLEEINGSASVLVERAQHLDRFFQSTMGIAQAILYQREQVQQQMDAFKNAVLNQDTDVPEVLELITDVQDQTYEDAELYMYEGMWEYLNQRIADATGLDESEADTLTSILTSEALEDDHPLWDKLRAWMMEAEALMEGYL